MPTFAGVTERARLLGLAVGPYVVVIVFLENLLLFACPSVASGAQLVLESAGLSGLVELDGFLSVLR